MMKNYKWIVVGMLWFVCFFNYADRQAIFSVFPLLQKEMGLSDVQLGFVGASFMYVYALAGPIAGIVGDRFNRKFLIISGLIFWSLITVLTAFSTKYSHLVMVRALEGFGEAFYFPASMALISDYHGPETKSRAMGIHQSSVYAGTIAGGAVSGYMGQHFGWRSSFVLFGSLGVVLGFILILALKEAPRSRSVPVEPDAHSMIDLRKPGLWSDILEILRNPMVRILIAVFVGANFVASIFLSWMPTFLYRKFSMSLSMAGLSGTAYQQIASIIGVVVGGILADRLVRRYLGGRMMAQALGLFGGVIFIFLTGWTLSVPVLIIAMAGFGFFKGIYDANIWASLYDVVKPERRATALGMMNSIGWLGAATAPPVIALASQRYGMSACLSANSMIYLFSASLMERSDLNQNRQHC
ncbi:MAG: MFS transporter [Acidobacteria bacterium]|nr:MFS transporter [Acidobacteriota bacterium]